MLRNGEAGHLVEFQLHYQQLAGQAFRSSPKPSPRCFRAQPIGEVNGRSELRRV